MARLRLLEDDSGPRDETFPLGSVTLLGRDEPSQILLRHPGVSRTHARIVSTEEGYFLEDMKSTNGTFLNGTRVQRARLHDGDTLRIHLFTLAFREETGTEPLLKAPEPSAKPESTTFVASHPSGDMTSVLGATLPVKTLQRRLEVLYKVSQSAAGSIDVQSLLEVILAELFDIFPQAENGFVLLREPKVDKFVLRASRKRKVSSTELVPSKTIIQYASEQRQAVLSASALKDSRFEGAQSIMESRTASVLCAPLVAKDDVLGVIYMAAQEAHRPFREDDLHLIVCVASTAAIFLENARLYEVAVQAQRLAAIGQAMSQLAHCIKNILNGIQSGSYIVDRGIATDDKSKVAQGWEITRRNNEFLSNLVLDMLSYAKKRKPHYEPTDINDLVQTAADLYKEEASKQGTTLRCELDSALPAASVDPVSVYRCILNLVSNAVDACSGKPNAQVCIRTSAPDSTGQLTIRVEDSGSGIPEDARARLFKDFFSTKGAKGTGLGLPVVKKIVEEHGGEMDVASEVGVGSVFTIRLPLSHPDQKESR